jgi:oligopeptide/dipeptide ABC transporter ATP-binding protein
MTELTTQYTEATTADPVMRIRDLSVTFPSRNGPITAVRDVSFDLHRGEIFGLVGESGSGKSTVLGAMMRLLPDEAKVSASELSFEGKDLLSLSSSEIRAIRGREIGLVPQRPMTSLSPVTSLRKQLDWLLRGNASEKRVRELLESVGLRAAADRIESYPYQFSGGQLQRLLIAIAAIADEPTLLLADEPTTTLDATVQAQVLRLIVEMTEQLGQTVLFVTHDLGVVAQICHRVGVMYGGRIMEIGTVDDVFHNPRHPYTQSLLEALPGRSEIGEPLHAIPGTAAGSNQRPGCPFSPRCFHAMAECHHEVPATLQLGQTTVNCHLVAKHVAEHESATAALVPEHSVSEHLAGATEQPKVDQS